MALLRSVSNRQLLSEQVSSPGLIDFGGFEINILGQPGEINHIKNRFLSDNTPILSLNMGKVSNFISEENHPPHGFKKEFHSVSDRERKPPTRKMSFGATHFIYANIDAVGCQSGIMVYSAGDGGYGFRLFHLLTEDASETSEVAPLMREEHQGYTLLGGIYGGASFNHPLDSLSEERDQLFAELRLRLVTPGLLWGNSGFGVLVVFESGRIKECYAGYDQLVYV